MLMCFLTRRLIWQKLLAESGVWGVGYLTIEKGSPTRSVSMVIARETCPLSELPR